MAPIFKVDCPAGIADTILTLFGGKTGRILRFGKDAHGAFAYRLHYTRFFNFATGFFEIKLVNYHMERTVILYALTERGLKEKVSI